jgi:hypothetical protein
VDEGLSAVGLHMGETDVSSLAWTEKAILASSAAWETICVEGRIPRRHLPVGATELADFTLPTIDRAPAARAGWALEARERVIDYSQRRA